MKLLLQFRFLWIPFKVFTMGKIDLLFIVFNVLMTWDSGIAAQISGGGSPMCPHGAWYYHDFAKKCCQCVVCPQDDGSGKAEASCINYYQSACKHADLPKYCGSDNMSSCFDRDSPLLWKTPTDCYDPTSTAAYSATHATSPPVNSTDNVTLPPGAPVSGYETTGFQRVTSHVPLTFAVISLVAIFVVIIVIFAVKRLIAKRLKPLLRSHRTDEQTTPANTTNSEELPVLQQTDEQRDTEGERGNFPNLERDTEGERGNFPNLEPMDMSLLQTADKPEEKSGYSSNVTASYTDRSLEQKINGGIPGDRSSHPTLPMSSPPPHLLSYRDASSPQYTPPPPPPQCVPNPTSGSIILNISHVAGSVGPITINGNSAPPAYSGPPHPSVSGPAHPGPPSASSAASNPTTFITPDAFSTSTSNPAPSVPPKKSRNPHQQPPSTTSGNEVSNRQTFVMRNDVERRLQEQGSGTAPSSWASQPSTSRVQHGKNWLADPPVSQHRNREPVEHVSMSAELGEYETRMKRPFFSDHSDAVKQPPTRSCSRESNGKNNSEASSSNHFGTVSYSHFSTPVQETASSSPRLSNRSISHRDPYSTTNERLFPG